MSQKPPADRPQLKTRLAKIRRSDFAHAKNESAVSNQQAGHGNDPSRSAARHAITADVGIGDTAHAVEFMRGDAVIVAGAVTGDAPQTAEVVSTKRRCRLPVYLGSGVTAKNFAKFYSTADGFIVGSEFKTDDAWSGPVDPARVKKLMAAHRKLGG